MTQTVEQLAGLRTVVVESEERPMAAVVMLHGYAMTPEDMAPFCTSMGAPAMYYLPEAPLQAEVSGRAWWPIDQERRAASMAIGPRDLSAEHPVGAEMARRVLCEVICEVENRHRQLPLLLVGFSQGGMLACDVLLRDGLKVAGLVLLSASRISVDEWEPLADRLARLPVLVSHGINDPDLAFTAGERLRDLCLAGGADVTWVPFEGDHGIPLIVWRALRKFIQRTMAAPGPR